MGHNNFEYDTGQQGGYSTRSTVYLPTQEVQSSSEREARQ